MTADGRLQEVCIANSGLGAVLSRVVPSGPRDGFTAELMAASESYISGRRGIAELTGTAQACISLWESGFAIADVNGTRFLDRLTMAMLARSLALRGEFVGLIDGDGITPCSDWDLSTRGGRPRAYRVSVSEAGGGMTRTVLAAEVLHVRIGSDPAAPWLGTAPLRRASLTAAYCRRSRRRLPRSIPMRRSPRRWCRCRRSRTKTARRWAGHSEVNAAEFSYERASR